MGRSKKGYRWRPSKGSYGIFGTHSGSERGKKSRGLGAGTDKTAKQIKDAANDSLGILLRQFERSTGPESTYQKQLDLETEAAGVAEEGFLAETDRQATAIKDATANQTKAIETQQAQTGFAASGSTGRAREDLARSIQEKGEAIYGDLSMKMGAQDIEMEKKELGAETELENELDRIQMEASSIVSQTRQALGSMERKSTSSNYVYNPNPELSKFDPTKINTDLTTG